MQKVATKWPDSVNIFNVQLLISAWFHEKLEHYYQPTGWGLDSGSFLLCLLFSPLNLTSHCNQLEQLEPEMDSNPQEFLVDQDVVLTSSTSSSF